MSNLEHTGHKPFDEAILELNKVYENYTARCPILSKLKFAWVGYKVNMSIYEFTMKFLTDNNIKAVGNRAQTDQIRNFLADQITGEDEKVILSALMNGDFIPFLTNLDRLREKYPDKFKMKSGAGETIMNSRNKKNQGN